MKIAAIIVAIFSVTFFCFFIVYVTMYATDFPILLQFDSKAICEDQYSVVKSKKVKVYVFLLHDSERVVPYNEIITVIKSVDSGKEFAALSILEGDDSSKPEKIKVRRKFYIRGWRFWEFWRKVNDEKTFIAEVLKNAPEEYLFDYRFTNPTKPSNALYAYKNLLINSGCTTHGPIG